MTDTTARPSVEERFESVVDDVELPARSGFALAAERLAFDHVLSLLRERERETTRDLSGEVWRDREKIRRQYGDRREWWNTAVHPFLRDAVPGVESENNGQVWVLDPERATRDPPTPPAPSDRTDPSEERLSTALEAFDYPGDRTTPASLRSSLRRAWTFLRENERGTREEIRTAAFDPGHYDRPEDGKFQNRRDWWVLFARPRLRELPGVAPPVVPGEEWVYVGVGTDGGKDTAETETETETVAGTGAGTGG